jgi:hypothetical protein
MSHRVDNMIRLNHRDKVVVHQVIRGDQLAKSDLKKVNKEDPVAMEDLVNMVVPAARVDRADRAVQPVWVAQPALVVRVERIIWPPNKDPRRHPNNEQSFFFLLPKPISLYV